MSEHTVPPPRREKGRKWIATLVVVLLVAVVAAVTYLVTLAPEHFVRAQAERVTGNTTVSIGEPQEATVTPGAEWSVRPVVQPLFAGLDLFTDPRVLLGDSPGVHVESPNGELAVELTPLGDGDADIFFEVETADGAHVITETLASGVQLRYANTGDGSGAGATGMVAVLSTPTSALVARVTLDDDAAHTLDEYRPDLSALFESVRL